MALISTYPAAHPEHKLICQPILQAFNQSMVLHGLSQSTRNIYLKGLERFLSHHLKFDINTLSYRELDLYLKDQDGQMHLLAGFTAYRNHSPPYPEAKNQHQHYMRPEV